MTVDGEEFARLSDAFRPELLAYCYRMLGSVHDAEDQVQETLMRAWRSFGDFEGRASMRTWLYRIATNACLRALENRERRPLPSGLGQPEDEPRFSPGRESPDVPWLQPIPTSMYAGSGDDPAIAVTSRETMRLALVAALQYLPPRQRAILLLRDVLGWRAAEVADLLGITTAAVNSLVQRARAELQEVSPAADEVSEPTDAEQRALVDRYAAAFSDGDIDALMALLRADATFEMPPQSMWFAGLDLIAHFLSAHVLAPGRFRMIPTTANGQPALVAYQREADGVYRAHAVQVLTFAGSSIAGVVSFNDPSLVAMFGFPPFLDGGTDVP